MQPPSIVRDDGWVHINDISENVVLYHKISEEEARYVSEAVRDIRTVAVIDVKGGVKKTTAAVHIAHGLYRHPDGGGPILLGDCDQYHSVADWANEAAREDPDNDKLADPWPDAIHVVSAEEDNFHFDLVDAAQELQPKYMVIDTPPNDEDAALRALLLADVMVTPTGPFQMDIRRLSYGLKVAAQAQALRGRQLEALAVLTGVKYATKVYDQARDQLREAGLRFVNMPVRDKVAHATAFGTSLRSLNDYDYISDDLIPLLNNIKKEH